MSTKQTILQRGGEPPDLFTYAHIAPTIIAKRVAETTRDAVVVELWGNGTAAYKPLLPAYGGARGWLAALASACGKEHGWRHWCLTAWSAGGQVAKDVCAGPVWPAAIVLLDAVYGSKPPGGRRGDGSVLFDASLQALAHYALSAARGERTMVLFHSRISTAYASSKECCEAIQRWVEHELGDKLGPDPSVTPELIDQHGFIEALAYRGLHIVEFAGIDGAEHITEAHLYDEVWKLWIPWTTDAVADTLPPPPAGSTLPTGMAAVRPAVETLEESAGPARPAVMRWQNFLRGQGAAIAADGRFGPATTSATKDFQRQAGLDPDGRVGKLTRAAAEKLGYESAPGPAVEGNKVSPPAPAWVEGTNWPQAPDFTPPVGTAARQAVFGAFAYEKAPTPTNPEGIRILGDWEARNIVSVVIPQLKGVAGAPSSGIVRFHHKGAAQLVALFDAWDRAGLMKLVLSYAGSYAPRFIRGSTTTLSNHAFGSAFDINAPQNPLGARPKLVGGVGSVRELVPLANAHGFYWGGHFASRPDGMHFELARPGM